MTDAEWLRQEADGLDSKYAPTDEKAKRLQAVLRRAATALDVVRALDDRRSGVGARCSMCGERRHAPTCRVLVALGETP